MVQGNLVGLVELVSGLPVRIGHPKLFLHKVFFEGFFVPSSRQQVSMAEGEVTGGNRGLERSDYLLMVFLNSATLPRWQTIILPFVLRHGGDGSVDVVGIAEAILGILANERP